MSLGSTLEGSMSIHWPGPLILNLVFYNMPVSRQNVTKAKDYNETIPMLAQKGELWNFEIYR